MEITYKIVEGQTEVEKDSIKIESRGAVSEFSLNDLKSNIKNCEKYIKEYTANATLQDAIANNVHKNNTELIDSLTEQQLHAIHMYYEAKQSLKGFSDKIKLLDDVLGKELQDLESVYVQLPELREVSAEVVEGEVKLNENE